MIKVKENTFKPESEMTATEWLDAVELSMEWIMTTFELQRTIINARNTTTDEEMLVMLDELADKIKEYYYGGGRIHYFASSIKRWVKKAWKKSGKSPPAPVGEDEDEYEYDE